jgi:hypothetical protein
MLIIGLVALGLGIIRAVIRLAFVIYTSSSLLSPTRLSTGVLSLIPPSRRAARLGRTHPRTPFPAGPVPVPP